MPNQLNSPHPDFSAPGFADALPDSTGTPDATQRNGRPCGAVRTTVASALASGLVGGCDVLAHHTGFPPESVRIALHNMLAAGQVDVVARAKHTRTRGRPRAVYAWVPVASANQASPLSWALAHVRTAWALPVAQTSNGGAHHVV